jgi:hypothetical protein
MLASSLLLLRLRVARLPAARRLTLCAASGASMAIGTGEYRLRIEQGNVRQRPGQVRPSAAFPRAALREAPLNLLHNPLQIIDHLIVAESHDTISARLQILRAHPVLLDSVFVMGTIDFDHEPLRPARKIDDVISDRMLTSEVVAIHLPRAKRVPQMPLRIGGALAQLSRGFDMDVPVGQTSPTSPPTPLLTGEGGS